MSLTQQQIDEVSDRLRSVGFDMSEVDSEKLTLFVAVILEALEIEIP